MANFLNRIFGKKAPNINENHESSKSQKAQILAYMQEGKAITSLEALQLFNSLRLGARIADLKKDGWPIESSFVTTNTGKRVKSYYIPGASQE